MRLRPGLAATLAVLASVLQAQAQVPGPRNQPQIVDVLEAPALTVLARRVAAGHPEVLAAMATLESRDASRNAAGRPLFNPELGIDLEDSAADLQTIGISQTFDIANERDARFNVADLEHQAALAGLADARRRIAGELLSGLAEYWTAIGLDELAETRIELMRTFAGLTRQRQQAGDLTQVELNIANLAEAQAEIEHASAESAKAGTDQSLRAVVTSQAPASWPELPQNLPEIDARTLDIEAIVAELPEIRTTQAELSAAVARIDLRERERKAKPTVGLTAGTEEDESLVGLTFSMPFNFRNRFTDEIAAARADRNATERLAENVGNRARRRLMAATERYRLTREAWDSWLESGQPNLDQQSDLLQRLVSAGELSTTDYLVQLNQTLDTAASAVELRHQLWLAWIEWLTASGQTEAWLGTEERP
jgi:cobalt-zinc-cadmium efflux system outer membrane protein